MKSLASIITFFLLLLFMPLFAQSDQDPEIALRLNKGDQLLYEIKTERSHTQADFNKEPQIRNTEQRTRLQFKVEEIPKPGTYLFSYKKLFTKIYTRSGDEITSSDSRFPKYGHDLNSVISAYLNSVEYFVLLDTKKSEISITNLEQIRTGLTAYVKSRGIEMDGRPRREIEYFAGEELPMYDLRVFNFYPGNQGLKAWVKIQAHDNKEVFNLINETDSTYTIQSKIPEFNIAGRDRVKQAGVRLPRELIIDSELGILLSAESIPKRTQKKLMNYHYKLELLSYSKWDKQTIICGQIQGLKSKILCLEYKSFMVGSDVDHIYIETKADGSFSIPLEIKEAFRYRLYPLESFPVGTNKRIHLYVEPGDSIYLRINQENISSAQFSGKGYENSEFLNRNYLDSKNILFLRKYTPRYFPPDEFFHSVERIRASTIETERLLSIERTALTSGFYEYMLSEIQSLDRILEVAGAIRKLNEKRSSRNPKSHSFSELRSPQTPYYETLRNLELFSDQTSQYASFRFFQLLSLHKTRPRYDNRSEQMVFSRIILEGYPLYADLVNQLEELAKWPDNEWMNYKYLFDEFLESCNNMEITEYVRQLFKQIDLLQAGNNMPVMDLMDLGGKEWDWDKTKGKTVVLMLSGGNNSAQYLCEDLYKDYGYNKKDVIILRISPGISFKHWKSKNSSYSSEMHQMYFTGGEDAFNERFKSTYINNFGFLVIDREGNIFRNPQLHDIKSSIKAAIALPLVPRTTFMETTFARILFGALLGMLLTFTIIRIIIHRRLKQRALIARMSELEQKAMKAQLNPHFLFNSLNSIQHLIRSNQQKEADSYLSVFASLIRRILDNSEKDSVPISEEMETIKLYLELEKMRFEFQYEIQIEPGIDVYNTMIPTMMLQPVVENAISHGLAPKERKGKLSIDVRTEDDIIIFRVEDNGIGREAASKLHHAHESKGLNIIHARIDLLNRTDPDKYKLDIIDLEDQDHKSLGTLVQISIPDEK